MTLTTIASCGNKPLESSLDSNYSQIESSNISSSESSSVESSIVESSSEEFSSIDYGSVYLKDIEITFMNELILNPIFSHEEFEEELNYTYEGHNISIIDGKVKGLVPDTITEVTAQSEHFHTSFNVKVNYINAILSNENGAESKFSVPVPDEDNYLLHFDVSVSEYINEYTRLSSFAFNGSNNSWYNIEMDGYGNIHLFACFNGIAKDWIFLGNKADFTNDGKIEYKVDIFKKGQATRFYFNNKLVCGYLEEEMIGYAKLSSFEVTSAADRENAGNYVVNLNNVYYELENSKNYQDIMNKDLVQIDDTILANSDGVETKYNYGDMSLYFNNYLYSTTIDVATWDNNKTRPCAFAFNGSDNSWYNIEMNGEGNLFLYGRFNGVEKYNIFLSNKDDLMLDGKIHFSINILKRNQATWFFFNERLVCWYTEKELEGYARLSGFEVTSATDVWQDGGAYEVSLKNTKFESDTTDNYSIFMNKVYRSYEDTTLKSDNGSEQRAPEIAVSDNMVYLATVVVKSDSTGWFRPSAFAFNNSDNSWYNIETDENGALTLFARFNGVEKYFISLGNKSDYLVDGLLTYNIAILKEGQATYFFFNDELKASFSIEDMTGYPGLYALFVTSCADRCGSPFEVLLKNQKVEDQTSNNYIKYKEFIV